MCSNLATMKNVLLLTVFILSFSACQQEASTDNTTSQKKREAKAEHSVKLPNATLNFFSINKDDFENFEEKNEEKILIERFCEESKGYQSNVWEGENECGWAIEKYKIEQDQALVSRAGDILTIQLENGKSTSFKNILSKTDKDRTFRYKRHLKKSNYFLIEELRPNASCPIYVLLNAHTGTRNFLMGTPNIAKDETAIITSSAKSTTSSCSNKIEYWSLGKENIKKEWEHVPSDWGVHELKWAKQNELYIAQITPEEKTPSKFTKIRID